MRLRRGAITSLGMCHSWVTKTRGTVEASGVTIGFSMKVDAVVEQELEGRHAFVGERAHQIAVVVAAVAALVVDPVGENLVGAVLDVELLLQGVAAAEMDAAAAQHGVAADVVVLLDDDHRGAVVARRHGGGEAGGARADDHDISRKIPFHPGIALSVSGPDAFAKASRRPPRVGGGL